MAFQWSTTLFEIVSFEVFIEELVVAPPSQWLSQDNFPNANLRVSKLENLSLHVQSSNELYKMRNIFRFDWILKKHNSICMVCIKRLNNIAVRIMYKLGRLFSVNDLMSRLWRNLKTNWECRSPWESQMTILPMDKRSPFSVSSSQGKEKK